MGEVDGVAVAAREPLDEIVLVGDGLGDDVYLDDGTPVDVALGDSVAPAVAVAAILAALVADTDGLTVGLAAIAEGDGEAHVPGYTFSADVTGSRCGTLKSYSQPCTRILLPQQYTSPVRIIAHECDAPAATVLARAGKFGTCFGTGFQTSL